MARAKSPEKRQAILQAAAREIAASGLGASTAKIAKSADLAEGTLFTYFPTKDELLNELYLELKGEAYRRINAEFPYKAALRERARHIWTEYLSWAIDRPEERRASVQLNVSDVVTAATRERIGSQRGALEQTMNEVETRGVFKELPAGFASSAMAAMQEAVMDTVARKPRQRALLVEKGFEAFWRMAK
ncbi:TetR/AcrR family transcriptional regulator [Granulicella aggregans]|uniref:TetR/AcrR family transcriptional regulator n=1 Tax=Granulicella aggregans TaxID=474949 RepID=UPI0021E0A8BA|nr:TetR/AcrR family transcriptional regulator [Granulicella aggregans]